MPKLKPFHLLLIVAALVIVAGLIALRSRHGKRTTSGNTTEGLAPDLAAALSGQPSTNAAPYDQLRTDVLHDLGYGGRRFDTIGGRMLDAANSVHYVSEPLQGVFVPEHGGRGQ